MISLGLVMFLVLHSCVEHLQCSKTFSEMFQDPFYPKKVSKVSRGLRHILLSSKLEIQTVSAFPAALHDPTSTSKACLSHFLFAIWIMILLKAY